MSEETIIENNSGKGGNITVPDEVAKRFNWGAFLLSWIWGIGNSTYITFLIFVGCIVCIIPFIGIPACLGLQIWFGIKGNKWAWQNKHFESIEQFHSYQKNWAIAGIVIVCIIPIIILPIIGIIAAMTLPTNARNYSLRRKEASTAKQITMILEALEEKCELSSDGLAQCFEKRMAGQERNGNVLKVADGTIWTFVGNGICRNEKDCKVIINSGDKYNDEGEIPLYANDKGFIYVKQVELDKYIGEK